MRTWRVERTTQRRSVAVRATVAIPVALLAFVVAYGALGIGRDTTPRIHSLRNPAACAECHVSAESSDLRLEVPELCRRCHQTLSSSCAVDANHADAACARCHDPHGKVQRANLLR